MTKPKVSVVCVSYNQERYINQAIDSFIEQKTNFEFEVLVADDSSTDKTAEIIKTYSRKYPKIIKPILRKNNIGVARNFRETLLEASGEYIALCEGDDYWTNINKLQIQVDYMEKYPSTTVCFHPVEVVYEDGRPSTIFPEKRVAKEFTKTNLFKRNYMQTNSVMYRRADYSQLELNFLPVDWYLHLYHMRDGRIGFINKVMSAYRRHPGGLWWDTASGNLDTMWNKYGISHIRLYEGLLKIYGGNKEYNRIISNHIIETIFNIFTVKTVDKDNIDTLLNSYQTYIKDYLIKVSKDKIELEDKKTLLINDINKKNQELQTRNNELLSYKNELLSYKNELLQLESELNNIKDSKSWKIIQKYRKIVEQIKTR